MKVSLCFIIACCLLALGCGSEASSNKIHSKSLKSLTESLIEALPKCNMPDGQTWYMRGCDDGDAMTLQASVHSFDPDSASRFVYESIGDNGRPYRSPERRSECESGIEEETSRGGTVSSSCDFSRDHIIAVLFYTLASGDTKPLKKILKYAEGHDMMFCPYSVSQCMLTPAVMDAAGDVIAHLGQPRPWYSYLPDVVLSDVTKSSAKSVDGYQMTLNFELILLKAKTDNLTKGWIKAADKGFSRFRNNLFYQYVYRAAANKLTHESLDWMGSRLEGMIESYLEDPVAKSWVWNRTEKKNDGVLVKSACGYDLLMLALLLMNGV